MDAVIHWFSASGNTARAAEAVAAKLAATGYVVSRVAIAANGQPPAEIPDLTVLAFPIWSWAAPHFVLNHARRLPRANGAQAAILATCGGFGAQGVGEAARILRRRGYRVGCSGEAVYPDSWTLAVNPPAGTELAAALAKGDAQVTQFADRLLSGAPAVQRCTFFQVLWSWPMAMLFRTLGRRFMGKFFIADEACTSCGQCVAYCPVRAIRLEGTLARPRWNAGCAGCYRCINLCPARAIQISIARLAIHLGVNLALTVGWLWAMAEWRERLSLALVTTSAAFAALTVLQLTALDGLLHGLERRPALRRFFAASYTKRFGRYRAPGFRPEKSGG